MRTEVKIGLLVCIIAAGLVAGYLMIVPGSDEIASDLKIPTPTDPPPVDPVADPPPSAAPIVAPPITIGSDDASGPSAAPAAADPAPTPPPAGANTPLVINRETMPSALPAPPAPADRPQTPTPTGGIRIGAATAKPGTPAEPPTTPLVLNTAPQSRPRTYIVQAQNNGLWVISRKLYGAGRLHYLIRKANPGVNTHRLRPGMKLVIPPMPAELTSVARVQQPPSATARRADGSRVHIVAQGDTCWTLAERYLGNSSRFQMIVRANPGMDASRLRIGQTLIIPASSAAVAPARSERPSEPRVTAGPEQTVYTIVDGDRLTTIARAKYGNASLWPAIAKANPGLEPDRLRIGRRIVLPSKADAQQQAGLAVRSPAAAMGETARASSGRRQGYVPGKPWFDN